MTASGLAHPFMDAVDVAARTATPGSDAVWQGLGHCRPWAGSLTQSVMLQTAALQSPLGNDCF